MSMRPTPCTPAIVSRLSISSVSGIATPLTATGTPLLELDLDIGRRVRRLRRRFGERVDIVRRLGPGILEHAALDGAPPEVLVRAVRARLWSSAPARCARARIRFPRGASCPTREPARSPESSDRARGPTRRCAPGRCPCPCSRAQWPWHSPSARSRPASWQSAAGRGRSRADSAPHRAHRPAAPAGCSRVQTPRARRARDTRTAPVAIARSRIWLSSRPCPRSSVTAMTSALYCSLSQGMATDVSSPPEYARTIRLHLHCSSSTRRNPATTLHQLPRQRLGVAGVAGNHQNRVVAGERADDSSSFARSMASASGWACPRPSGRR